MAEKRVHVMESGGRGDALNRKLYLDGCNVSFAPGNGDRRYGEVVDIAPSQFATPLEYYEAQANYAERNNVDLSIASSDGDLIGGIVDVFRRRGLPIFGPTAAAARIEGSKDWGKYIARKADIRVPHYASFEDYQTAFAYVESLDDGEWLVIKYDGPALGKGTKICKTKVEAYEFLYKVMVEHIFGKTNDMRVVIEEYVEGEEFAVHYLTDGDHGLMLPLSKDYKPAYDGDQGDMTGSMGSYCPFEGLLPTAPVCLEKKLRNFLRVMKEEGVEFTGCYYPSYIMGHDGPRKIEGNCRPGDSETQVIIPRLKSKLFDLLYACTNKTLHTVTPQWSHLYYTCVNLVAEGYPGTPRKGMPIFGIEDAEKIRGAHVLHAGTKWVDGILVVNGGRVLNIVGSGTSLAESAACAYEAASRIHFDGMRCRSDIGRRPQAA